MFKWISRGTRSTRYDLWVFKPVLKQGNFVHRDGEQSKKNYFSYTTIDKDTASTFLRNLPERGETIQIKGNKRI